LAETGKSLYSNFYFRHPPIYHGATVGAVYMVYGSGKLGLVTAKLATKAGIFKNLT
jgi:hypothetical protein